MIPVIASLVLAPMDAKAPDVERVFRDFRGCLNTFDEWAGSFWSVSRSTSRAAGWACRSANKSLSEVGRKNLSDL